MGKKLEAVQASIKEKAARWTAGENPVTNLSDEQKKCLLGVVRSPETKERLERLRIFREQEALQKGPGGLGAPTGAEAPAAWDWRNAFGGHDWTTLPKNQGFCGSCVAFGTIGALEALYKILRANYNLVPDYSEAHLFFCNNRQCNWGEPNYGWDVPYALDYLRDYGVPDDACFAYTDHDQPCATCPDWKQRVTQITGWKVITSQDEMKNWLANHGPLVADFDVYEDFRDHYTGGVYSHVYGKYLGGHCVLVVGYNDADKCWICKNSWFGTQWGEKGFFRIEYNQCTIDDEMYAIEGIQNVKQTFCLAGPTWNPCYAAPITCPKAPVYICYAGPNCHPAPHQVTCPPISFICPVAPTCHVLPIYMPGPIGPVRQYGATTPTPSTEETLVPVTIWVPKKAVEALLAYGNQKEQVGPEVAYQYALKAAEQAYCTTLAELGMTGEYAAFPGIKGCMRGPFQPKVNE